MGQCALAAADKPIGPPPSGSTRREPGAVHASTSTLDTAEPPAENVGRFFSDITRTRSFELRAKWSGTSEPIPSEFVAAAAMICVEPSLMASTRALVSLQAIEVRFRRDPSLHRRMSDQRTFERAIAAVVMRAYNLSDEAAALQQRDLLHDCLVCERVTSLYSQLEWRQPYLTYALELISAYDDADALPAKLSEVCDRAERCSSAKRHAFSLLISRAYELLDNEPQAGMHADAPSAEPPHLPLRLPGAGGSASADASGRGGGSGASGGADGDLATLHGAHAHVHRVFGEYLDEYKERAIASSYTEPARFYFDSVGDTFGRDHVTVHGVNWFLAMLHAALGVQAPFLVDYEDRHVLGIADVWLALSDDAWAVFSAPDNFGRQFGGIRALRERRAEMLVAVVPSGQLPRGHRTTAPKILANMAVHAHSPRPLRLALARYAERFASFFATDPFARRCFESLWSETKPEYAGFRRASATLYAAYRAECGAVEPLLIEHVYSDEYFSELDIARVSDFLAWAGLLRPSAAFLKRQAVRARAADAIGAAARGRAARRDVLARRSTSRASNASSAGGVGGGGGWARGSVGSRAAAAAAAEEDATAALPPTASRIGAAVRAAGGGSRGSQHELELTSIAPAGHHGRPPPSGRAGADGAGAVGVCPICCEHRVDIEPLPHWQPTGDVSGHRMCAACRAQYTSNTCPFCKDVLAKDELLAHISAFIDSVSARARLADPDPNELAALLERWQTFEMELDSQPSVLRRVTRLIVEDPAFSARLAHGVQLRASWLRDTAGVLFRFHALCADGELDAAAANAALLAEAVERLLEPFERTPPAPMHGHFYGALYTQALVPWLCAWRSGTSTRTAAELVRRVGYAIVRAQRTYGPARRELRGYVRARMHLEYVQLAHAPVWGRQELDVVWQTFYIGE